MGNIYWVLTIRCSEQSLFNSLNSHHSFHRLGTLTAVSRYCCHSRFAKEETEVPRDQVTGSEEVVAAQSSELGVWLLRLILTSMPHHFFIVDSSLLLLLLLLISHFNICLLTLTVVKLISYVKFFCELLFPTGPIFCCGT